MTLPAAKIGLGVFLAVAGSLFALFISAYSMRMNMVDWRALPVPFWRNGFLPPPDTSPLCFTFAVPWRWRGDTGWPSAACRSS